MLSTSRALAVVWLASMAIATPGARQSTRPASLLLDHAYVHETRARGEKGDAAITAAISALEEDAKKALAIEPMSVMDKSITPPSGDRHDYMSQAPYWWPDPSKPDGKPYIRKDGQRNPEISKITDRDNLGRLGDAVTTLSLAYAYTGREQYATHARAPGGDHRNRLRRLRGGGGPRHRSRAAGR